MELQKEYSSFDAYIWHFTEGLPVINHWTELSQIPAHTELSDDISRDLKERGFRFIGSTIIYSHLQAVGIVNDHLTDCFRFAELVKL